MADYLNGKAPETALVHVDGVHMVPAIAPRVEAFFAEAAREGHILHVAKPYGGYRNLHEQQIVYEQGATGGSTVHPARPGLSTHGIYATGRVDIVGANGYSYTKAELAWVVANAGRFGLVREFGADDPNHFEPSGTFAGTGSTPIDDSSDKSGDPIAAEDEEEDMYEKPFLIQITNANRSQQWALVYPLSKLWIAVWTVNAANGFGTVLGVAGKSAIVEVGKTEWNEFRAQCGLPADTTVG